jgi:2-polyprenyl-3-methyl-5-hydroxy-6-metoxy-1,4-benzoquinol methylase
MEVSSGANASRMEPMRRGLKNLAMAVATVAAKLLWLIPFSLRKGLVSGLLLTEARIGAPRECLGRLFRLWDDLDLIVNERATAYGNGLNPKHRLTGYHDFFAERIPDGGRVLDVGCGIGAVARTIATRLPEAHVTAIDSDPRMLEKARALDNPSNLVFVEGDAARDLPAEHWDVVVLSNVLEHMDGRVAFLQGLLSRNTPQCVLIRVPLFERHWHNPLRKELGLGFFSDPTHRIEHTLAEFEGEMAEAGLEIVECRTLWGEIWARCELATI